jgi:outer membrane protein assembly factor BamB
VLPAPGAERQWPRFRGPSGQGSTGSAILPLHWDKDGDNILWRVKIPARGNSSPIVWCQRIFLTGATVDGRERFVFCFRVTDGRLLWSRQAPVREPERRVSIINGYASATPVTDGERVIAFLGACGLISYDFDGNQEWHFDDMRFDIIEGTASSPVLYKDSVIFIHDQDNADSVFLALDKRTGKLRWQRPRQRASTWSTPVVVRVADHDELIFTGGETVKGYNPADGTELWTVAGAADKVIPTMVVGTDLIYSASGQEGLTLALRPGGIGDVTGTHIAWRSVRGGPRAASPLYHAGRLYQFSRNGSASCLNAQTGEAVWKHRIGASADRIQDTFSASPLENNGMIYVFGESGTTYVLRAGDHFEVVAENDLGSPILASPAVAGDRLIVRTHTELICIRAAGPR